MDNGNDNGKVGYKNPPKETQFTSENQPSPEAKAKGWERKREAQKILDEIMKLGDMSYGDIRKLIKDVEDNPDNHTLREVKLVKYLAREKFTTDWLDRHVSKAPQQVDLSNEDGSLSNINFVFKQIDESNAGEGNRDQQETDGSPAAT